jgi:hypothetical protein
MNSSNRPSKGPGVFCKLANMLGFELFDLLCNLVQESSQGVRFVVANLTDQGVKVGYKTVVISNRFRGAQMQLIEDIAGFSSTHLPTSLTIFIVRQNVANVNRPSKINRMLILVTGQLRPVHGIDSFCNARRTT